jgi:cytoskeletal protein RodZ
MKINRNNKLVTSGLAAIAVAGLALGAVACSGSDKGEASESREQTASADSTIEESTGSSDSNSNDSTSNADNVAVADDASLDTPNPVTDYPNDDVDAPNPTTDADASADTESAPEADAPVVDSPVMDALPGLTPNIDLTIDPKATVDMVQFVGNERDVDASVFVTESGFGANDIVSVKFVYFVGTTKVNTNATLGRTVSSTRSVWSANNMFLTSGKAVTIWLTDINGVTTRHDTTVRFVTVM